MSYTYYQAKNPSSINIQDEHVTESELPERLLSINNKTQNFNDNCTAIKLTASSNIFSFNTYNDLTAMTIENSKAVSCYGALLADSINPITVDGNFVIKNQVGVSMLTLYGTTQNATFHGSVVNMTQNILDTIKCRTANGAITVYNQAGSSITTFNNDRSMTVIGNITAPNLTTLTTNLTGIVYNPNFNFQDTSYIPTTIINQHLFIDLTNVTYHPYMGMRAYKPNLVNNQETMIATGRDVSNAISFVYHYSTTSSERLYRLDHPGLVAYQCKYGDSKTEHSILGNLKVFGTVTENASRTITHYTQYEGDLQPGCFVESTGKIFKDPNSLLSPYEDCISVVRQATYCNNNIIGVCTEILNEEILDVYGNISQPSGKYCKFATHGDILVKCESSTYTLGDILIPSKNGFAKKANNMEIIDAITHMIPRLKVTSVDTDDVDPQTVCGFIQV